ncbi:hypothetical protein E8E12_001348 [Didymella heteroderae]|uniref:PA14 domain-containing protein n=1 Tax=Didymella heteroderae TaxID=1769908 RepID=A0A9P4WFV6_9PLEO|nr:hypothetical protein E8E12_001348 [Didymella heteroderae]
MTAGALYPIVLLYGNGPGDAVLQLNIATPAGKTVTDTTGYFAQPICANSQSIVADDQLIVPGCAAIGIEFRGQSNPSRGGSTPFAPTYPGFSPDIYNVASPVSLFNGITNNIQLGIATPATSAKVYSQGPYDVSHVALNLRGYFVANVTGSWTFTLANPDDAGLLWLGSKAVNTWSSANADITAYLNTPPASYTITLVAGSITPIRMVMANGGGGFSFALQTKDPNGVIRQKKIGCRTLS